MLGDFMVFFMQSPKDLDPFVKAIYGNLGLQIILCIYVLCIYVLVLSIPNGCKMVLVSFTAWLLSLLPYNEIAMVRQEKAFFISRDVRDAIDIALIGVLTAKLSHMK